MKYYIWHPILGLGIIALLLYSLSRPDINPAFILPIKASIALVTGFILLGAVFFLWYIKKGRNHG